MWYLKKTAETVWNMSKTMIDNRTPVQKLIDSIADSTDEILSTNKLGELAAMTYQLQLFEEIVDNVLERLKKFTYDVDESFKSLNLLICTNYLIKHGATATVDILRTYKHIFKKYEQLQPKQIYEQTVQQSKLDTNLQKIKSRAHHIYELLQDKQKLLKQKELSMLVKQKLKLYQKNRLKDIGARNYSNSEARSNRQENLNSEAPSKLSALNKRAQQLLSNPQELSVKLQGLLETYVWKYVDKLDYTIEAASDKIMEQIDRYVVGEPISKFQMESPDEDNDQNGYRPLKSETTSKSKPKKQEVNDDDDLMNKIDEEVKDMKEIDHNDNLLEFQEVSEKSDEVKKQAVDLI